MNKALSYVTAAAVIILFAAGVQVSAVQGLPEGVTQMRPFVSRLPVKMSTWRVMESDASGVEKPGYDDSAWKEVELGYGWNGANTTYWFRAELTLPDGAAGKPVFLSVAVDDGGEVFADGEKILSFSGSGEAMLVDSAKAGQRFLIAIKAINNGGVGKLTFAGYKTIAARDLMTVKKAIDALGPLRSIAYQNITGWKFNAKGGKKPASLKKNDSKWKSVTLSHSWQTSAPGGWYRSRFTMPAGVNGYRIADSRIELDFRARDTGDVYVNGKRRLSIIREGALDVTGKIKPGDSALLAVKVSNLTGNGSLQMARIHALDLDPAMKLANKFAYDLEEAALFIDQRPGLPEYAIGAIGAAYEKIQGLSALPTTDKLIAGLKEARESLRPLQNLMKEYPVFLKGPYLQNVQDDGVTICWETNLPAASTVYYGRRELTESVSDPELKTIHKVTVTGLAMETEYKYVAASGRGASPTGSFKTKIERDAPFKFAVWGDNRTDPISHESVVNAMIPTEPDIAINVGDVVTHGSNYEEWGREYFQPMRRLAINVPTYISIGNHEYGGYGCGNPVTWFEKFVSHPEPNDYYYSFTYGNSYFMILNPQEEPACYDVRPGTKQYDWMLREFESDAYKNATFRFVFLHEPPYSEAWSGGYYDGEASLRAHLVPQFEKYGMDIVFAGHTHDYERGQWPKPDGPYYIITGGGGSSLDDTKYKEWEQIDKLNFIYHFVLVTVDGKRMIFEAIDRDGNTFDRFEIEKD